MNYLERKELLENQGWTARTKIGNEVVFAKSGVYGLLIAVDWRTGDYKVCDYCPEDYLIKHLPQMEIYRGWREEMKEKIKEVKNEKYDEKETPKKVKVIDEPDLHYIYYCPSCGATLMVDRDKHPKHLFNFCGKCGQPLDWNEEFSKLRKKETRK